MGPTPAHQGKRRGGVLALPTCADPRPGRRGPWARLGDRWRGRAARDRGRVDPRALGERPTRGCGPRLRALSRRCAALCSATRSAPAAERYRLTPESARAAAAPWRTSSCRSSSATASARTTRRSSSASVAPIDLEAGAPRGQAAGPRARRVGDDEGRATPPNAFDVTTRIVMGATKAQNLGEARERENARKSASKKLQQLRAMSKLGDDEDGDGIDWASEDAVRRMFRLFDDSNDKIVSRTSSRTRSRSSSLRTRRTRRRASPCSRRPTSTTRASSPEDEFVDYFVGLGSARRSRRSSPSSRRTTTWRCGSSSLGRARRTSSRRPSSTRATRATGSSCTSSCARPRPRCARGARASRCAAGSTARATSTTRSRSSARGSACTTRSSRTWASSSSPRSS